MKTKFLTAFLFVCLIVPVGVIGQTAKTAEGPLEGIWVAQSMETEGKAATEADVQRMRFTFKGDKLFIKGNFNDEREETCTYKVDVQKSPRHLSIAPPKEVEPTILGIYEVNGDELKLCLRHERSSKGRPTEFATATDSDLVLIVFKKQKS